MVTLDVFKCTYKLFLKGNLLDLYNILIYDMFIVSEPT